MSGRDCQGEHGHITYNVGWNYTPAHIQPGTNTNSNKPNLLDGATCGSYLKIRGSVVLTLFSPSWGVRILMEWFIFHLVHLVRRYTTFIISSWFIFYDLAALAWQPVFYASGNKQENMNTTLAGSWELKCRPGWTELTDWLTDCLTDWLTDWLVTCDIECLEGKFSQVQIVSDNLIICWEQIHPLRDN